MTDMAPPTSQRTVGSRSGVSFRSNGTRAATQVSSSTNISTSCGEGSIKAMALVRTVMNSTKFSNRSARAAELPGCRANAGAIAGLRASINKRLRRE